MEDCDSVWVSCGEQNKNRLEKMQRRAARTIAKPTWSDDAVSCLWLENLESRRDRHVFNLVHNCILGKSHFPLFLSDYSTFNRDIVSDLTGQ